MREPTDVTAVEQDLYHTLSKLFLLLDDADRQFFGEFGLSTRQFWALYYLDEQRGISMVDLSRSLLTDKSNITAIVDRLESIGLAKRGPDPHDRRVILITLTPKGRRQRDQVIARHETRISELFSAVPPGQLHQLLDTLTPISESLEAHVRGDAPVAAPPVDVSPRRMLSE